MKRYLLFAGSTYYPSGGMEDFIADFDELDEAKKAKEDKAKEELWGWGWVHIYDQKEEEIVLEESELY